MPTIGQISGISGRLTGMATRLGGATMVKKLNTTPMMIGGKKKSGLAIGNLGTKKSSSLIMTKKTQTGLIGGLGTRKMNMMSLATRARGFSPPPGGSGGVFSRRF